MVSHSALSASETKIIMKLEIVLKMGYFSPGEDGSCFKLNCILFLYIKRNKKKIRPLTLSFNDQFLHNYNNIYFVIQSLQMFDCNPEDQDPGIGLKHLEVERRSNSLPRGGRGGFSSLPRGGKGAARGEHNLANPKRYG